MCFFKKNKKDDSAPVPHTLYNGTAQVGGYDLPGKPVNNKYVENWNSPFAQHRTMIFLFICIITFVCCQPIAYPVETYVTTGILKNFNFLINFVE